MKTTCIKCEGWGIYFGEDCPCCGGKGVQLMDFSYISVCSGIEAATVAWEPLGWKPKVFAEIEKFPCSVLAHHYPNVPNVGDFTQIKGDEYGGVDLLVGGTPCQDFSVAGLRAGLDGKRGQLTIEFARLAERLRPTWLVWENVPGVLSIEGGRAFGTFLAALGNIGYGFAYRVLDARYFGVPQRRRRVFVVGHLGDWRRAAAVLFEREGLFRNPPPSRKTREEVTPTIGEGTVGSLQARDSKTVGNQFVAEGKVFPRPAEITPTLDTHYGDKQGLENQHINGGGGLFVPHLSLCEGRRPDYRQSVGDWGFL